MLDPGVELEWNWHHQAICDHAQAVFADWKRAKTEFDFVQRIRNFLVNVPPGTAKSRIISVFFPPWVWLPENWPAFRFLCISGTPDVVVRDAGACKQLIEDPWFQENFKPTWKILASDQAKTRFANTAGGRRMSKGMTAKVTGLRADGIIVDDPHDMKDMSDVKREAVVVGWRDGWRNRLNDLRVSFRIGICQRGHEADWSAAFLEGQQAVHLNLPQEYGASICRCPTCTAGETPLGWSDPRRELGFRPESAYGPASGGKVLHPVRFPPKVLADELANGAFYYATQHNQAPAPPEGGIVKKAWLRYADMDQLPARFDRLVDSVDAATKAKDHERGSNTSMLLWGEKGPCKYLIDNVTGPELDLDYVLLVLRLRRRGLVVARPDVLAKLEDGGDALRLWAAARKPTARPDLPEGIITPAWWAGRGKIGATLVEDTVMGSSVCDTLAKELTDVVRMKPRESGGKGGGDDKVTRLMATQPSFQAHNVILLRGAPWLEGYVHELTVFPNGAKDDQVDATSQFLNWAKGSDAFMSAMRWKR